MDVYQASLLPPVDIKPFVLEDVDVVDQDNLQKLSNVFGIEWVSVLGDSDNHNLLCTMIIGKMGKELNVVYESWLVGNKYVPQHAVSYKSNSDDIWWRTSIESALGISDQGWFNFLTKLYMSSYDGLSIDIATKIQKVILESI